MDNELINLLPPERQHALSREYLVRISVMVALLVAILTITAGVLLIPTFVFLTESATAKQAQLANVEAVLSSADEVALSARLAVLSGEVAQLNALGNIPSAGATIRTLLATPRPGVMLSNFDYVRASGKVPGTLTISGIATTRDALRSYQMALQSAPFTAAANLPVSAYAKDTNIEFTISITLAP